MQANPLSYQEIEAFERKTLVCFSAWETDLICALDDAALKAIAGPAAKAKPDPKAQPEPIPATNVTGMKALFRGMAAKMSARAKAKGGD